MPPQESDADHVDLPAPLDALEERIYIVRGHRVMLDSDLAQLYGVKTEVLNQSVRRNIKRFPDDYMITLSRRDARNLISQFVISRSNWGGRRKLPRAFTELGVAMLSSVLRSERAIQANIAIMRAFVHLRRAAVAYEELATKLAELEQTTGTRFDQVFDVLRRLIDPPVRRPKRKLGFSVSDE